MKNKTQKTKIHTKILAVIATIAFAISAIYIGQSFGYAKTIIYQDMDLSIEKKSLIEEGALNKQEKVTNPTDFNTQVYSNDFFYIKEEEYFSNKKNEIKKINNNFQKENCLESEENCFEIHSLFGDGQEYQNYKNPSKNIDIYFTELLGARNNYIIFTDEDRSTFTISNLVNPKKRFSIGEGGWFINDKNDWYLTENSVYIQLQNYNDEFSRLFIRYDLTHDRLSRDKNCPEGEYEGGHLSCFFDIPQYLVDTTNEFYTDYVQHVVDLVEPLQNLPKPDRYLFKSFDFDADAFGYGIFDKNIQKIVYIHGFNFNRATGGFPVGITKDNSFIYFFKSEDSEYIDDPYGPAEFYPTEVDLIKYNLISGQKNVLTTKTCVELKGYDQFNDIYCGEDEPSEVKLIDDLYKEYNLAF